jgi:hypothetical protein
MFGNCKDCRAYHKIQKPYCESGRIKRAFMRFTFRIYGAIADVKARSTILKKFPIKLYPKDGLIMAVETKQIINI